MNAHPFSHPLTRHAWIAAVLVFVVVLFSGTRFNDFPAEYHPDEPSKVDQVLLGELNFHHPLLLLQTAKLFAAGNQDRVAVAQAGRLASALFAAGAAAFAVLIAAMLAGNAAAWGTALLMAVNNQLFELAHYFKEDPALGLGVAIGLAALLRYGRHRSKGTAVLLGAAAALAGSGKYVGLTASVLLPIAIFATRKITTREKAMHFVLFLVAAAGTLLLVNAPILASPKAFEHGLGREIEYSVKGHDDMTQKVPHLGYTSSLSKNVGPVLWAGLLAFYMLLWKRRRGVDSAVWICAAWPLIYITMLSFSPKVNDRYFLPATIALVILGTVGLWMLAKLAWPSKPSPVAKFGILLLAALAVQLPRTLEYWQAFRHDDRKELAQWMTENLPHDSAYVEDLRAMLPPTGVPFPFKEFTRPVAADSTSKSKPRFAADYGSIEELRAAGIRYVVISESDYGRYFRSALKPKEGSEKGFNARRGFYEEIQKNGKVLWERPRSKVIYLHPGLKLVELPSQDTAH